MGFGVMRLVKLMVLLGAGFLAIAALYGAAGGPQRHGLTDPAEGVASTAPASEPATAPDPVQALPATVRRLADTPVSGPLRPVILGERQPVPVATSTPAPGIGLALHDIRRVTSTSANVRGGPSTGHAVVGRVTLGEEVEVVEQGGNGWLRIRLQGDGVDGWISARLVGPSS